MRIIHFAETLLGGPATHLRELLPFQVERYGEVSVFCPDQHSAAVTTPGVTVTTFAGPKRTVGGLAGLYRAWSEHIANNHYDIVHLHSSFAGGVGRTATRGSKAKIVYCARGWSFAIDGSGAKRRTYQLIERVLAPKADAIINISEDEMRLAHEAGISGPKNFLVYNGIADRTWLPLQDGPLKRLLFVGRYDRQKGIDILLAAASELHARGYEITTIGGTVLNKGTQFTFPHTVRNLGWKTPEEIQEAMRLADAIVMPSRWEGFGFVAAEALRAGRPVVAAAVGGLPEIVVEGVSGALFERESVSGLLAATERLAKAPLAAISHTSRQRYEQNFTSRRMFEQIDDIYRIVLDRP